MSFPNSAPAREPNLRDRNSPKKDSIFIDPTIIEMAGRRQERTGNKGRKGRDAGGREGGRTRALQQTVTSRTFIRIRACLPRLDDIRHFPVPASLAAEMQYYAIQKCASVKVFTQPILLRYFTRERGGVELGDAGVVTLREEPDTGRIYF